MLVSVRFSPEEEKIIESYCALHGISMSEAIRSAVLEKIEDEFDLLATEDAIKKYEENPVTLSWEQVKKELNL